MNEKLQKKLTIAATSVLVASNLMGPIYGQAETIDLKGVKESTVTTEDTQQKTLESNIVQSSSSENKNSSKENESTRESTLESNSDISQESTPKSSLVKGTESSSKSAATTESTSQTESPTSKISPRVARGSIIDPYIAEGVEKANEEREQDIDQFLSSSSWSIIRQYHYGMTDGKPLKLNWVMSESQITQKTAGFPIGKLYLGVKNKDNKVISSSLIYDTEGISIPGLSSAADLKNMSLEDRAGYAMYNAMSVNVNNISSWVIDSKDSVASFKPNLISNSDVPVDGTVGISNLKGWVADTSSDFSSYIGSEVPFDEVSSENYYGLSSSQLSFTTLFGGRVRDTYASGSVIADLVSENPVIFTQNNTQDSNYTNPEQLLTNFRDDSGQPLTGGYKVSWQKEPDLSKTTTDGRAIILITQSDGLKTYIAVPYSVENKTTINVQDSTIYVGDTWKAEDNFVGATAADGTSLTYNEFINRGGVVDSSALNTKTPGKYPVTYTLDGVTSTANITVLENKQSITGSDVTKYVGDLMPEDAEFKASATDKDGNPIDVTVDKSKVNMAQAGDYDVLLTAADGQTKTVQVHVKEKQTKVNVHDSTIYVGDKWTAEDNFDSALDKDGNPVDFADIEVDDSKVDPSKAGVYEVTYTYDGVTSTATVTVKDKQTAVNVHDSTIYVGDKWTAKDNFDSAIDKDGNPVDFADITVNDSQADTSKAGQFDVTYTYDGVTSTVTVTVKDKQTAVNVHDSTIYVGDKWTAEDNFDSALDKDGNPVDFADIEVDDSKVDPSKAGVYEVTYTYDGVTSTATVTVKDKQTAVNVHDSTIYVGDKWTAEDNFDSALDKDGKPVDFADIEVDDSKVDPSKAGVYEVTYTYDGVTSTATVTVKDKQTAVNVHDSTIYVGDKWTAKDNFDSALDKDGNPVDFADIEVDDSKVDPSKAGVYEVTYTYDGVTSTATVTVKDKQTAVNVHDSTIYVGDKWTAEDNFDSALDKDGNPVDFADIEVDDSKVDTSKAGTYEVTYTYDGVTSTATVTVKDKQTAVNVHDSTIYVGDNWKAEDNFDSALDKDGNDVAFTYITVDDSQVDTSKVGQFDVTYTYDGVTSTATITVKKKQTAVNVHDSTIYVGDAWKAEDNFDSALDKDGNNVVFSDITVDDSKVDPSKAGMYEVMYTYDDVASKATVTVRAKELPNNKSTVVIQYVDENGNKISKDTVLTGKAGDDYHTEAKYIKGYELTKTPKNKDGKFKKESITVTYLYKERNAEEADIDQSGNSSTEHGKSSRKGHTEESRQQDTLPKTGEKSSVPEVILGVGILLLVGIGFFWRKRKNKE